MTFETPLQRALKLCVFKPNDGLTTRITEAETSGKSKFNKDYSSFKLINRLPDEITITKFEKYNDNLIKAFTTARLQYLNTGDMVEFTDGTYTGVYRISSVDIVGGFFLVEDIFVDESLNSTCSIIQKQDYNEACAWYILASTTLTAQELRTGEVLKQSQQVGNGVVEQSAQSEIKKYQDNCYTEAHKIISPDNKYRVYFG